MSLFVSAFKEILHFLDAENGIRGYQSCEDPCLFTVSFDDSGNS